MICLAGRKVRWEITAVAHTLTRLCHINDSRAELETPSEVFVNITLEGLTVLVSDEQSLPIRTNIQAEAVLVKPPHRDHERRREVTQGRHDCFPILFNFPSPSYDKLVQDTPALPTVYAMPL